MSRHMHVMVPMRDGVRLATDIYLPEGTDDGPWPVLLTRSPYDKVRFAGHDEFFTARGYVFVVQYCRGRFDSEGEFVKYVREGEDGYDTVEWLAAQDWCDGKVGTMGLSYMAHVQQAMAVLNPPHLKAMFMIQGGFANAYKFGTRQGGALELKAITWALRELPTAKEVADKPWLVEHLKQQDLSVWFDRLPLRPGHSPLSLSPEFEAYVFEQWTHGEYDDYWKQLGVNSEEYYDRYPQIPAFFVGGWYDQYAHDMVANYLGAQVHGPRPEQVKLLFGPWSHGLFHVTGTGEVDFGAHSAIEGAGLGEGMRYIQLRWFDHWLKGKDNGAEREPPVRLFIMGGGSGRKNAQGMLDHGGRWVSLDRWPEGEGTPWYLRAGGRLDAASPGEAGVDTFQADPDHPVPTIGGPHGLHMYSPMGAYNQVERPGFLGCKPPYLPTDSRPDVLAFDSAPLEKAVEVVGSVRAHLWVSSSVPDTDFTVKLVDVYPPSPDWPDGFALGLTDGILRARYHQGFEEPRFLQPGEVVPITVELMPTANRFAAGHRIRVEIAGSNFPKFDVNPNTGEPQGRSRCKQVATNTVHYGPQFPSHIELPVHNTEDER